MNRYLKKVQLMHDRNRTECILGYNKLCLKSVKADESLCDGDEGGPIIQETNGITKVIGLISHSNSRHSGKYEYVHCNGDYVAMNLAKYSKYWFGSLVNDEYCSV